MGASSANKVHTERPGNTEEGSVRLDAEHGPWSASGKWEMQAGHYATHSEKSALMSPFSYSLQLCLLLPLPHVQLVFASPDLLVVTTWSLSGAALSGVTLLAPNSYVNGQRFTSPQFLMHSTGAAMCHVLCHCMWGRLTCLPC